MKTLNIILASVAAMILLSCASTDSSPSDTVKQTEIHQDYEFEYNFNSDEWTAFAQFRFGGSTGTTLILSAPSNITFNGEEMAMKNSIFQGTFYSLGKKSDLPEEALFSFTDTEGKIYTNSFALNEISIIDMPDTIDLSQGATISWSGPAISNNEEVRLVISDSNGLNRAITTDTEGATSISINAVDLTEMVAGQGDIFLIRVTESSLSEATHLGGNIKVSVKSAKKSVTLSGQSLKKEDITNI